MREELHEELFGPEIDFREYSFFDNKLVPKQVKDSWLDIQLCSEGPNCNFSNKTSQPGVLRFPKHSSEEQFRRVFSSFKNVKVLQFSSMQDAFAGFTDKLKEEKFRMRVMHYAGLWCCLDNHVPGHIYYDMYWDETPNWKPVILPTQEEDRQKVL